MAAATAATGTLVAVGFGLWFARCKVARGWLNPEPDTTGAGQPGRAERF